MRDIRNTAYFSTGPAVNMCVQGELAMVTYYRIYDETDDEILADKLNDLRQAYEVLELLRLQYPNNELTIEDYQHTSVKPGFGRDPDLH